MLFMLDSIGECRIVIVLEGQKLPKLPRYRLYQMKSTQMFNRPEVVGGIGANYGQIRAARSVYFAFGV